MNEVKRMLDKFSTVNAEMFELGCQAWELSQRMTEIQEEMKKLGFQLDPNTDPSNPAKAHVDMSRARSPRWRKKVSKLFAEADEIVGKMAPIQKRLAELGVAVEA